MRKHHSDMTLEELQAVWGQPEPEPEPKPDPKPRNYPWTLSEQEAVLARAVAIETTGGRGNRAIVCRQCGERLSGRR